MRRITWTIFAIVALSCLAVPAMAQRGYRGGYGPSYGRSSYYGGYRGYSQPYTTYYRSSPSYGGYSTYGYPAYGYPTYGYPAYGGYQNFAPNGYYPVNPGYGGYYSSPGFSFRIGY